MALSGGKVDIVVDAPTQTVTFRHRPALMINPVEIVVPFAAIDNVYLAILMHRTQPQPVAIVG